MKKLAIIKGVSYGCRDVGRPVLWFSTHDGEGGGALQVLEAKDANKLIEESEVHNIKDLEGKPCWVEVNGMNMVFVGLAKI